MADWQRAFGTELNLVLPFLKPTTSPAESFPCPAQPPCECRHVVRSTDSGLMAVCCCEPFECEPLPLEPRDLIVYALDWPGLGGALCRAFGLNVRFADLKLRGARQIGSWSADSVPVLLTLASDRHQLTTLIAQLALRLRRPFILLAPTSDHLDARCQELLANAGAGFFPLDANVRFNERGALHSVKTPGELFARFTPAPKEELDEDVARRAFALVQQLDSGATNKAPTTLTVFRLYCMEELSAAQIARKYRCSKATIISRLNCIRAKTGVDPANLRRLSAHLGKMEADLTDSRAERIHRKNLIYDKEQES